MALSVTLTSLGDNTAERGITPATAIQSPAVFNFLATIDDKPLEYVYSDKVGCSWNFGDANAQNVLYGPRAGQSTNTLDGTAMAAKVFRVPLGGGVQSFDVTVAMTDEFGQTGQVVKTIYVKAADYDKEVVAVSNTLDPLQPELWVGVPAGATLTNTVPNYFQFSNKLTMFHGGETFTNEVAGIKLAVHVGQENFAITSFGTGKAIAVELAVGEGNDNEDFPSAIIRDEDLINGNLRNGLIYNFRAQVVGSPGTFDDLTFVDIDGDWSAEEIANSGQIGCHGAYTRVYSDPELTFPFVPFSQKFFLAESVFKSTDVHSLGYDQTESENVFDYMDVTGRTVTSFVVEGDPTVYTAGQTAVMATIGSITINSDGSYTFTADPEWDEDNVFAHIDLTDSTSAVTPFNIGQVRPNTNCASINSSIMNMVLLDVQCGGAREHQFRHMGNQFFLTQDCDALGQHDDRFKHCFTYRSCEQGSPTDVPVGSPYNLGATTVNWWGGHERSVDALDNRVLDGSRYLVRQHCRAYQDTSVDAASPFHLSSTAEGAALNESAGMKYVVDYGHDINYEDTSSEIAEFLTSGEENNNNLDFLYIVNIDSDKSTPVEAWYEEVYTTSVVDPDGDLPQATITPPPEEAGNGNIIDRKVALIPFSDVGSVSDLKYQNLQSLTTP